MTYTLEQIEQAFNKLDTHPEYGVSWDELLEEIAPEEHARRKAEKDARHKAWAKSGSPLDILIELEAKAELVSGADRIIYAHEGKLVFAPIDSIEPTSGGFVKIKAHYGILNGEPLPQYLVP